MPPSSNALRFALCSVVAALLIAACGSAETPRNRIGDLAAEGDASGSTRGSDPREGLGTGAGGGSDPTKGGGASGSLTSGVGSGTGGADPTGTAQRSQGFDGTASWEMLTAQLSGVVTTTYSATYAVAGNPAVKSVSVVNQAPRQAVTVTDAFGNRHWALFVDSKPQTTCISSGGPWRCAPFDPDDYTRWVSALLTTGFSPTFLAGLLAPGLLAEGPVPSYSVGTETVLGQSATCVTTVKVDTWPGAKVCVDSLGVPLTVANRNLGTITATSLVHAADPGAFVPPGT